MQIIPKCNFFNYLAKKSEEYLSDAEEITVLDVGCGDKPYEKHIKEILKKKSKVINYIGIDYYSEKSDLKIDLNTELIPLKNNSVDLIICTEVLEHLYNPFLPLSEFQRIIKPNGVQLITIPLLSPVHHENHDYFRFTHHYFRRYFKDDNILEEICSNTFLSYFLYVFEYYLGRFFDFLGINIGKVSTKIVGTLQMPFDWLTFKLIGKEKLLSFSCYTGIGYLVKKKK